MTAQQPTGGQLLAKQHMLPAGHTRIGRAGTLLHCNMASFLQRCSKSDAHPSKAKT